MPTEKKQQQVQELKERLERCHIAIATDYRGMPVTALTSLRRRLREHGIEYKVVKNRLALLAADQAGKPEFKKLLEGPCGVVFGYGDPQVPAKVLDDYLRATRAPLVVRAALMDGRVLTPGEVRTLATLPPRPALVAQLIGQLQVPLAALVNTLNAPLQALVTVLQRGAEQLQRPPS